jgi:uncharacterized protein (DUF1697 family)
MTRSVALLRGINVGTSARIGMADLRAVFEGLGLTDVRTYLQSGNVVFTGSATAAELETAIAEAFPVSPRVLVFTAAQVRAIAAEYPLRAIATNPSRAFIMFMETVPASIDLDVDLGDEKLVLGKHAIHQWIPDGAMDTRVPAKFSRSLGLITVRNLRTVDTLVEWLDA